MGRYPQVSMRRQRCTSALLNRTLPKLVMKTSLGGWQYSCKHQQSRGRLMCCCHACKWPSLVSKVQGPKSLQELVGSFGLQSASMLMSKRHAHHGAMPDRLPGGSWMPPAVTPHIPSCVSHQKLWGNLWNHVCCVHLAPRPAGGSRLMGDAVGV